MEPARPRPPVRSSRGCATAAGRARVQGHRRLSLRRDIPRDGGFRRAPQHDLHRPRHRHDDRRRGPALTRTMLTEMTQGPTGRRVVFGARRRLLGAYVVEAILAPPGHPPFAVGGDPVGQRPGGRLGRREAAARAFGIEPCAVTGPATDNAVGVGIIEEQMGVRALNAMSSGRRARRPHHREPRAGGAAVGESPPNDEDAHPHRGAGRYRLRAGEVAATGRRAPHLDLAAVASDSQPDEPVAQFFRHLPRAAAPAPFAKHDRRSSSSRRTRYRGVLRGCTASRPRWSTDCSPARRPARPRVVDISDRFPTASAAACQTVYKHPRGAPARSRDSPARCPVLPNAPTPHVAHPGCFATAILLASVPLLALGLAEPRVFVSGITGSTGSGPADAGTHHPQRHSDLYAYNPLPHATPVTATALARRPASRPSSASSRLRSVRARHHVTVQAVLRDGRPRTTTVAELRDSTTSRRSCAWAASRRGSRTWSRATTRNSAPSRAARWPSPVRDRQPDQGRAGGAVQWMNRCSGSRRPRGSRSPPPAGREQSRRRHRPITSRPVYAQWALDVAGGEGVHRDATAAGSSTFTAVMRSRPSGSHPRWLAHWRRRRRRCCSSRTPCRSRCVSGHAARAVRRAWASTPCSSSGAEANENALEARARLTGRSKVVASGAASHGRTTPRPVPLPGRRGEVVWIPARAFRRRFVLAATLLRSSARRRRKHCGRDRRAGAGVAGAVDLGATVPACALVTCPRCRRAVVLDEVQCGMGHYGSPGSRQLHGLSPDSDHDREGAGCQPCSRC